MPTLTDMQWKTVMGMLVDLTALDEKKLHPVQDLIREVNVANGIREYIVRVRWLDGAHPAPRKDIDNPEQWPPELTDRLVQTTPIYRADIQAFVETKSPRPIAIHVTRDPAGVVGWMKLEDWG
jgi:hypothetical protein